jgi:hypothetical protein
MSDDDARTPTETTRNRTEARRKFLKTAGQVAVTTPAVTLLLSAGAKQSQAGLVVIYVPKGNDEDPTDPKML